MSLVVLDASVAAEWFLPAAGETLVEEAAELLSRYANEQLRWVVPDLFRAEVGNVFWKAVRLGRWTAGAGETAISELATLKTATVPSFPLLESAFAIATTFDRTVYDRIYVALAVISKAQFVTADERLARTLAATLPVKWLGSAV